MTACTIDRTSLERYASPFGIQHASPRISWRFAGAAVGWRQRRYELKVDRGGQIEEYHVESEQSTYVTWPSAPLKARERAGLSVRAIGVDNEATPWSQIEIERGLDPLDWRANVTLGPENRPDSVSAQRPYLLRKRFTLEDTSQARLYVTALGLYEVSINGRAVGDHVLAPGWQSYSHRLHYQTFDISDYLRLGDNEISAWIGEGWYAGRLGWAGGRRNIYGADTGLLAQLEVGGRIIARTGEAGWEWSYGRLISSEIYDGEVIDYRIENHTWQPARSTARPSALLLSPEAPPVRRQHTIHPVDLITTPSGKCILDFGQNLVGWLRVRKAPAGRTITIRHAEVLEKGELGTRPLRVCKATDRITTPEGEGSVVINWEPKFTFHGFRYVEIAGWDEVDGGNVEAVVVYSDMERLGDFRCSHEWITKFHQNTVWGLRGNFVSIPTDCPQRDERMGWTGDLQVFAPTASFLYDTSGLLGNWLDDVALEQKDQGGVPPLVVPNILTGQPKRFAIWADVTALTPRDLYEAFGDERVLRDQWQSMVDWLEQGVKRDSVTHLWSTSPEWYQLGDWLDPSAPEDVPDDSHSDTILVANAFLVHTTGAVAHVASVLGKPEADHYSRQYQALRKAFQDEYITANGMIMSDTHTTLALALHFGLFATDAQRQRAASRLDYHVRRRAFKVYTGFAGTPVMLPALVANGYLQTAYRMFQENQCPSLLYSISMGATTIWERWNSMLPDGTVNPGEMTSFNHYALGSVSRFLYETVGGLSLLEPGWKKALIRPQPGGTVTSAEVWHMSPYGRYACQWEIREGVLKVDLEVPPNAFARVVLPGVDEVVGSGKKRYEVGWKVDPAWPPRVYQPPAMRPQLTDEIVE